MPFQLMKFHRNALLLKPEKAGVHAACHRLNPITRDRDSIFMGALVGWSAI